MSNTWVAGFFAWAFGIVLFWISGINCLMWIGMGIMIGALFMKAEKSEVKK